MTSPPRSPRSSSSSSSSPLSRSALAESSCGSGETFLLDLELVRLLGEVGGFLVDLDVVDLRVLEGEDLLAAALLAGRELDSSSES